MHIEPVHFEEVFDVQAGRGDFSFRSAGRTHYGVNMYPGVIPAAGSTWLVAFTEPGNWATVLGWRDCQSRSCRLREPTWHTALSGLGSLAWWGPFFLAGALLLGGPSVALAVLLAICSYAGLRLVQVAARNRQVRQALCQADVQAGGNTGPTSVRGQA